MSIPRPVVDEILTRTDIAELIGRTVTLRRNGRNFVGLCPFHNEKSPSFNVLPQKGIYHCFGCGEGGDAVKWLRKTRGMSFVEALKELAGPAGVVIEERELTPEERKRISVKADLYAVCDVAAKWFHTTLLVAAEGAPGRAYLERRGLTLETIQKYRIGFAPEGWTRLADQFRHERVPDALALQSGLVKRSDRGDRQYDTFRNRVIFPILDDRDRPIAFGGRLLDGEGPKYLNSPESPIYEKSKVLYGLSWARTPVQRRDRLILVEGYFDAVSLWQAGFGEAVATCGTALTPAHLDTIRKLTRKVVALFDGDEAGLRAATRSMELFLQAEVSASRLDLLDAKDPDEFVVKHGAEAFEERLTHTEPLIDLVVRRTFAKEGSDPGARSRALDALIPAIRRVPATLQTQLVHKLAGELNIRESDILARLSAAPAGPTAPSPNGPRATPPPARWVPTRDLAHLLWLTIHFPAEVAPVIAQADPELVTDRADLLQALIRLCTGEPFAVVADTLADPELARQLRSIAARDAEYQQETAESSAQRLLASLELPRLEAKLRAVNAQIAAALTSGDKTSYASLKAELAHLNARRLELEALRVSRSPRT